MHAFDMRGAWGTVTARFYDWAIASGVEPLHEKLIGELLPRVPTTGQLLDVGCGAGRATAILARRRPEASVVGVDLSDTMIAMARARTRGQANLRFETASALELPFADGTFNGAMSIASVKHWPDPVRGVREVYRVLKPGSGLFLAEADAECTPEIADDFTSHWRVPRRLHWAASAYFHRFVAGQGRSSVALRRYLEDAGFADVESGRESQHPVAWAAGWRR